MFEGASNLAKSVDFSFLFVTAITGFFFFLIVALMVFFVFRYNQKRNPRAVEIRGNLKLEIAWTVIPTILVILMFFIGLEGYVQALSVPDNALQIQVRGQMWFWHFTYQDGTEASELHVPLGKPVRLNLVSGDVIHSFYIPAMRIKRDVVPGMKGMVWFTPEKKGSYDILCAEFCGVRHSYMTSTLIVESPEDFNNWIKQKHLAQKGGPEG